MLEHLVTKVHIPRDRPATVKRERLLARLNQGLSRRLILVAAPAGFGKTTLVANWLAGLSYPAAWLTLDQSDADPARLVSYLVVALRRIEATIGQGVEELLSSPQLASLEPILTAIINDIATVSNDFVLVLDDYHLLSGSSGQQVVAQLLARGPAQLHLVLITRREPSLPLAGLRARDQLVEVRAGDLRFRADEAALFLQVRAGLGLRSDELATLQKRTEGWIAGLQLAALSLQGRERDEAARFIADFGGSHRHMIDYLTEEVMARLPDEVATFLRQTAVLDRFCAPLCQALTGRADSEGLLRWLDEANLFLVPLDRRAEWFRYHHLFAAFLRTELASEEAADLHRRAASWFADQGLAEEAVTQALAVGDPELSAELIARFGYQVFQRGNLLTLLDWLDALPEGSVLENPQLLSLKILSSFIATQSTEAEQYLPLLEDLLPAGGPSLPWGRLLAMKAWAASRNGESGRAVRLAREALHLLADDDPFARSFILVSLGQAQEAEGEVQEAADSYRAAWSLAHRQGAPYAAMLALANLALSLGAQGRRREAERLCLELVTEGADRGYVPHPPSNVLYAPLGIMRYHNDDLMEANGYLERGLTAGKRVGFGGVIIAARYFLGRARLAAGDIQGALAIAHASEWTLVARGRAVYYEGLPAALEAQVHLQEGNLVAAGRWARQLDLAESGAAPYWYDQALFTWVRIRLAQQRFGEILSVLDGLERRLNKSRQDGLLITAYLQRACLNRAVSGDEAALLWLKKALALAAPEGYIRPFLEEGPTPVELLPRLRAAYPAFTDRVLEAGADLAWSMAETEAVDPLTPREREVLALIAEGLTNPEIAAQLVVAESTVKKHINHIFSKLAARDRTQAILQARRHNLL